jgi:MFS superfamily sulfate permease-like transporter
VADLQAGVVVGIVAIPLALAFAIASGVAPEKGEKHGVEGLTICTVLAGVLLLGLRREEAARLHPAHAQRAGHGRLRIRVLDDLFASFSHHGVAFLIAGIHAQPLVALDRAGRLDRYGRENFLADLDAALARATEILAASPSPPRGSARGLPSP